MPLCVVFWPTLSLTVMLCSFLSCFNVFCRVLLRHVGFSLPAAAAMLKHMSSQTKLTGMSILWLYCPSLYLWSERERGLEKERGRRVGGQGQTEEKAREIKREGERDLWQGGTDMRWKKREREGDMERKREKTTTMSTSSANFSRVNVAQQASSCCCY